VTKNMKLNVLLAISISLHALVIWIEPLLVWAYVGCVVISTLLYAYCQGVWWIILAAADESLKRIGGKNEAR